MLLYKIYVIMHKSYLANGGRYNKIHITVTKRYYASEKSDVIILTSNRENSNHGIQESYTAAAKQIARRRNE